MAFVLFFAKFRVVKNRIDAEAKADLCCHKAFVKMSPQASVIRHWKRKVRNERKHLARSDFVESEGL